MAERPTVLGNLAKATKYNLVDKTTTVLTKDEIFYSAVIEHQNDFGIFILDTEGCSIFLPWSSISQVRLG